MFIIFGTKTVKKTVPGGYSENEYCSNCRQKTQLLEYTVREYFSLFFIPIFPISPKRSILTCSNCNIDYVFPSHAHKSNSNKNTSDKKVIKCPACKEKLKIPELSEKLKVTCPHCKEHFIYDRQFDYSYK